MEYISTKDAAEKWGISQRRVVRLASEGRIVGAALFGVNWMIPVNAEKPADGRTRAVKATAPVDDSFRFPLFVNFPEDSFTPPLSEDERMLRRAQVDFFAYRFNAAREPLTYLAEQSGDRYVRIMALYLLMYVAIYDSNFDNFQHYYTAFNMALSEDFPHQREMKLLRYQFDTENEDYRSLWDGMHIDQNYSYHPSVHPTLSYLSLLSMGNGDFSFYSRLRYDGYELMCNRIEEDGHFLEAQKLHCLLVEVYQMQSNEEMMLYHMRRVLKIALEHELYFVPSIYLFYYPTVTSKAFDGFPEGFAEKIRVIGLKAHERYLKLINYNHHTSYLKHLSEKDFIFITYAVQGYSNREMAKKMKRTEKTVSKRLNEIYAKLGVKSKIELITLVNETQNSGISE